MTLVDSQALHQDYARITLEKHDYLVQEPTKLGVPMISQSPTFKNRNLTGLRSW